MWEEFTCLCRGMFKNNAVRHTYGSKGNLSVPPPVILKLMLLLFLFNVRSERELMTTLPLRLDWLWFLGYDIEDDIPDHSVLSTARIGKHLMNFAEVWAQNNNYEGVIVRSDTKRTESHHFYLQIGYELLKDQKVYIRFF